ncbi:hypothetical protein BTVI_09146 [Pitangus sulphuratus]|nr:hypothetical protein BTVI_09146 [Pitangus sulphuratus]
MYEVYSQGLKTEAIRDGGRKKRVPLMLTDIFMSEIRKSLQERQNQDLPKADGVHAVLITSRAPLKTLSSEQKKVREEEASELRDSTALRLVTLKSR